MAFLSPSLLQVWQRLGFYKNLKAAARRQRRPPPVVGVLGCMAERLKQRLLESDRLVDVVAGPDAYRCAGFAQRCEGWEMGSIRMRGQLNE